jgi:hypothetical protein
MCTAIRAARMRGICYFMIYRGDPQLSAKCHVCTRFGVGPIGAGDSNGHTRFDRPQNSSGARRFRLPGAVIVGSRSKTDTIHGIRIPIYLTASGLGSGAERAFVGVISKICLKRTHRALDFIETFEISAT